MSGLHKLNAPKNKKKQKPEMHEKKNVIHDTPMDIDELLSGNQHEEWLRTDTNFFWGKVILDPR